MTRVKTFEATGVAPNGKIYAGDLNDIQDHFADLMNLAQTLGVGSLAIGELASALLLYGAGDVRLTAALRTDGILRGLGGLYAGAFTTAQRDAIIAGKRPYGLVITNTDNNRLEWNAGTDGAPNWQPVGPAGPWGTANIVDGAVTSAKIADGTIVNADIAAAAAIAFSKLAGYPADATKVPKGDGTWGAPYAAVGKITVSAFSGGPPASPASGDIWIAYDVVGGTRWMFQYHAESASAYKWEFMGGPRIDSFTNPNTLYNASGNFKAGSITGLRAGEYLVEAIAKVQRPGSAGMDAIGITVDNMSGTYINGALTSAMNLASNEVGTLTVDHVVATSTGEVDVFVNSSSNTGNGTVLALSMMVQPRRIA